MYVLQHCLADASAWAGTTAQLGHSTSCYGLERWGRSRWWREGSAATGSWSSSSSSSSIVTSAGQHAKYAHEPVTHFVIPIPYMGGDMSN